MSSRAVRILAATLWALSLAFGTAGLVFAALNGPDPSIVVPVLGFATVGALLASRRRGNAIGWVFSGAGLGIALGWLAEGYAARSLVDEPGSLPGGLWAAWVGEWAFVPAIYLTSVLLFLLFPDGRPLSPRWRVATWVTILVAALLVVGLALKPGEFDTEPFTSFENPAGIRLGGLFEALAEGVWVASIALLLLAGASLIVRFRRAGQEQRQQIKWVTSAGLFAVAGVLASNFAYGEGGAVGDLTRGNDLAIAGSTLAVAALFRPARRRIQAFVDRRFYRSRYDAETTLRAFTARLRDEVDLDTLGGDLRAVVHETMQPAHVSIWLRRPEAPR